MSCISRLGSISITSLLILSSACIDPAYPDEFDDVTMPVTPVDAGLPPQGVIPGQGPGAAGGTMGGPASTGGTGNTGGTGGTGGTGSIGGTGGIGGTGSIGGTGGIGGASDAGTVVPVRDAGSAASDASAPRDASASVDASTGSEGGTANPGGTVASCTITATTDASTAPRYRGKYGCAVWIANSSNKVVKAFLVATFISSRSGLPTYRSQVSGVTVDATTSATLNAARQHMYTWNAANAPAGKYSLNVETHSENGVKLVTVPFDTSNGPVSAMGTPNADTRSAAIDCK